jgi:hypothetical protein
MTLSQGENDFEEELQHRKDQNMSSEELSSLLTPYTRYFIVKSFNYGNIEKSKKHSVWSTTAGYKERKLYSILRSCPNVILFFSVNQSRKFQGFAKVIGYKPVSGHAYFEVPEGFRLGGSFVLKWLRTTEMHTSSVYGMNNPLNGNEPVTKSRDS